MRALLVVAFVLLLAAPAAAQTMASPVRGAYDDIYIVAGRAIDKDGLPLSGGNVSIEVPGVKPFKAGLNCKGDFIADFPLRRIEPGQRGRVVLEGVAGAGGDVAEFTLDPFYRRSDIRLELDGAWNRVCSKEQNVWEVSASVNVRLLNRTQPYQSDGETFHARPFVGLVDLWFEAPGGNRICPPHPQIQRAGVCERFTPDERGDVRYTFTLDQAFEGGGRIEVIYGDNKSVFLDVDPRARLATRYLEVSGQGPPPELYETPGVGALLLLGVVGASAMAFSRRRR